MTTISIHRYWRDAPGYGGLYEVNREGDVRSIRRKQLIAKWPNYLGYMIVTLWKNGKKLHFRVGRLVASAFIGPCPCGMELCHMDGDNQNDDANNLRWDTHKNNEDHKINHGTRPKGATHGSTKLTELEVRQIRSLKRVEHIAITAKKFGISSSHVSSIQNKKLWKHLAPSVADRPQKGWAVINSDGVILGLTAVRPKNKNLSFGHRFVEVLVVPA